MIIEFIGTDGAYIREGKVLSVVSARGTRARTRQSCRNVFEPRLIRGNLEIRDRTVRAVALPVIVDEFVIVPDADEGIQGTRFKQRVVLQIAAVDVTKVVKRCRDQLIPGVDPPAGGQVIDRSRGTVTVCEFPAHPVHRPQRLSDILVDEVADVQTKVGALAGRPGGIIENKLAIGVKETRLVVLATEDGQIQTGGGRVGRRRSCAPHTACESVRRDKPVPIKRVRAQTVNEASHGVVDRLVGGNDFLDQQLVERVPGRYLQGQRNRCSGARIRNAGPENHCIRLRIGRGHPLGEREPVALAANRLSASGQRSQQCGDDKAAA